MKRLLEMLITPWGDKWWEVRSEEGEDPSDTRTRMFVLPALVAYVRNKLNRLEGKDEGR